MTAEQFVYWLQGFMEVANPDAINKSETQVIKDHLKLVFDKQTPDRLTNSPVSIPFVQPTGPMYEPGKPYWEIDPNRVYCSPTELTTTELTTITTNTPICEIPSNVEAEKPSKRWTNRGNVKC
jgi:hypothetical protein